MQRTSKLAALAAGAILVAMAPRAARAHFDLLQPTAADNASDGGKGAPPCGPTTSSNVVTKAQGGHPLSISLKETVMHPGHYRFALALQSRAELPPDPAVVVKNGQSVSATIEDPAVLPVLADGVFAHTSGTAPLSWQTSVVLPNVTCAKCTLQVIEFMAEHGANPGGGYFYHHCADLQITADPSLPLAVLDGGTPDAAGPGDAAASGGAGGSNPAGPDAKAAGDAPSRGDSDSGGGVRGNGGAGAGGVGGSAASTTASNASGGDIASTGGGIGGSVASGGASSGGSVASGGASSGGSAGHAGSTSAGKTSGGCSMAALPVPSGALAWVLMALVAGRRRRLPRGL